MNSDSEVLIELIRLGIGHEANTFGGDFNWERVKTLADEQGLTAIVLDAIEELQKKQHEVALPQRVMLKQWIGEVLQRFEFRYDSYCKAIAEMADFYNSRGYRIMVIKGYACSINWPKPEHRPIGDIDIYQFGDYKKADALLSLEKGITVDNSHHHHTVFFWGGFMVENHYDFINVHHHKSNAKLEKVFKELAKDKSHFVDLYGEKVFLPSPNLHALFLLKHTMNDFAAFSMTLRQVLDWGFYVKKNLIDINWEWLLERLEEYHMKDFFRIMNSICMDVLGFEFDEKLYLDHNVDQVLMKKVLDDILSPEYLRREPDGGLLKRLVFKFCRWKGNGWKHKLCYNESMWSAFWSGIWNHILKPKSI